MPAKRIRTARPSTPSKRGRADLATIDATTDADIARQIAEDPDTAPEFTNEMFASAEWVAPMKKTPIALRVDPDVLDFFRAQGPGYQSRMNAVLRSYVSRATAAEPGARARADTSRKTAASAAKQSARRGKKK
jgi:uncharacterized protein (DUF4415 family)